VEPALNPDLDRQAETGRQKRPVLPYNSGMPAKRRTHNPATLTANVPTGIVQIVGRRRTFLLREPIDLDVRREAGRWVIQYEPLNVFVAERNEDAAFAAFAEMFETVWHEIVEAPDRQLTADARDLKAAFRDTVYKVQDIAA
jgi:hypothetical protein